MTGAMHPFSGRSGNSPAGLLRIQYGLVDVTGGIAAGGYTDAELVFEEPFAAAPALIPSPTYWGVSCSTSGITVTGGTIRVFNARTTSIGGTVPCRWIAVGV